VIKALNKSFIVDGENDRIVEIGKLRNVGQIN
jgi:hypothetical protein